MPISRASVSWCTACVIRLTGLEKLISHARGASLATRRPYSTIAGMVRTAMANPAGPTVSCPMLSSAMQAASSFARWAAPPTRMLVITKSAPSMAASAVVAQVTRTPPAMRCARSAMMARRAWSRSYNAISEIRRSERDSPPASRGTRTPAPPMMAIFIFLPPSRLTARQSCCPLPGTAPGIAHRARPPGSRR